MLYSFFFSGLLDFFAFFVGWRSGTSLKGLSATPTGRPLFQRWWLRNRAQKTFLYDLLVCLVTLGGGDCHGVPHLLA